MLVSVSTQPGPLAVVENAPPSYLGYWDPVTI